jgi:hypothetical protein
LEIDAEEQEKIENAFSNSALAKRATAILEREDIAKMLKDETPLIDVYYAQQVQRHRTAISTQRILFIIRLFYWIDTIESSIY